LPIQPPVPERMEIRKSKIEIRQQTDLCLRYDAAAFNARVERM